MTVTGEPENRRVALTLLGNRFDVAVTGSGAGRLAGTIGTAWSRCLTRLGDPPDAPDAVDAARSADDPAATVLQVAASGGDEAHVLHALSARLTVAAIEARLGQLWMLHACALADPATGATVVLVGPSGAGKTTVAAALGQRFGYLTDETAAIQPDGTLLPFPKPLSVLVEGRGPKQQVSPDDLGLQVTPADPWLAAVALLDRTGSADASGPVVEAVRTVEALPELAAQTSALQLLDRPLHLVAGHLHRTGGLHRITYREAADLSPVVTDLISDAA